MSVEFRRVGSPPDDLVLRPVALIVLCGECGNREVGWAWHQPDDAPLGAGRFAFAAAPVESKPNTPRERRIHTDAIASARQTIGRRWKPPRGGSVLIEPSGALKVTCSKHEAMVVPPVDWRSVDASKTVRIRATKRHAP